MLRIVFMGSPSFAVPTLEKLITSGKKPVAVYTQPDRPAGRGLEMTAPPVKTTAKSWGVPVFQPLKFDAKALEEFRSLQPDLAVVVAYGKILPQEALGVPRFGCINLHASLLPYLRGAAPIVWSILQGDTETGVSVMKMEKGLDSGPILHAKQVVIPETMTGGQLHDTLARFAATAFEEFLERHWDQKSPLSGVPQDHSIATYAPKITPALRLIDWTASPTDIVNKIRAFSPSPGAQALVQGGGPFQILQARKTSHTKLGPIDPLPPGTIVVDNEKNLAFVATASPTVPIELLELKAPGGKPMVTSSFLRGNRLPLAFVAKPQ